MNNYCEFISWNLLDILKKKEILRIKSIFAFVHLYSLSLFEYRTKKQNKLTWEIDIFEFLAFINEVFQSHIRQLITERKVDFLKKLRFSQWRKGIIYIYFWQKKTKQNSCI